MSLAKMGWPGCRKLRAGSKDVKFPKLQGHTFVRNVRGMEWRQTRKLQKNKCVQILGRGGGPPPRTTLGTGGICSSNRPQVFEMPKQV
jgi:hypothetical protein